MPILNKDLLPFIEAIERLQAKKLPVIQTESLELQHFPEQELMSLVI